MKWWQLIKVNLQLQCYHPTEIHTYEITQITSTKGNLAEKKESKSSPQNNNHIKTQTE